MARPAVTNVSSSTSFAAANPASRSPNDHSRERRPLRQLPVLARREILRRPLDDLKIDARLRDVAVRARVGPAGVQALQRIDGKRQLLVRDLDLLERVARELLGVRRHGEDRMPTNNGSFVRIVSAAPAALTSSAVSTPCTPGIASAALASMLVTRAAASGSSAL